MSCSRFLDRFQKLINVFIRYKKASADANLLLRFRKLKTMRFFHTALSFAVKKLSFAVRQKKLSFAVKKLSFARRVLSFFGAAGGCTLSLSEHYVSSA